MAALEYGGPFDPASRHAPPVEDQLEARVGEEHPSDPGVEVRTVPGDDDEERNQYQPRAPWGRVSDGRRSSCASSMLAGGDAGGDGPTGVCVRAAPGRTF